MLFIALFLFDAASIDVSQEGKCKCTCKDNDFKDCNLQSILDPAFKLLLPIVESNILIYENFAVENSHNIDLNDEEAISEFISIDKDNLTATQ